VGVVHATAEHAGRRLDVTICQRMRVRGGKLVEVRGLSSNQAAIDPAARDAFWVADPARDAERGRGAER
jgi:hypothetical protein